MDRSVAIRRVLSAAKRQWWVVLQAVVIVGLVAGWTAKQTPEKPYETNASFLVKPVASDGSEQVSDIKTFYLATSRVLKGEVVAGEVAAALPQYALSPQQVTAMASLSIDVAEGSVTVFAKGDDPAVVTAVANAYGSAYATITTRDRSTALEARRAELEKGVADAKTVYDQRALDIINAETLGQDVGALTADRNLALNQYTTLSTQYQQLLTQIATQPRVIELLQSAPPAERPPLPSVPLRTAIGAFVGLVIGLGLASLRETLDDKLRSNDDANAATNSQVIAELPKSGKRIEGTLPVVVEPHRSLAESIRSLRTTIRFLGVTEPIRCVAITSPAPGDGKSMVAANLAAAFALAGSQTVLVSGDLRRPSIDPLFSASGELGMSDLILAREQSHRDLGGSRSHDRPTVDVNVEDYLSETSVPGLRLLPAGTPVANPAELLGSPRLPMVIKDLVGLADIVIVDCPPVVVADAVVLAKVADGAIMVTSRNRSRRRAMRSAAERLAHSRANLLGVVVNRSGAERKSAYGTYRAVHTPEAAAKRSALESSRRSD